MSAAWSRHLDLGSGLPSPQRGQAEPMGSRAARTRFLSASRTFSALSACTVTSSGICERAALCIIKLRSLPPICSLMALTSASSSATPNARVENQALPSHEPAGQTARLFLRKRRSGSQKRKLAFHSKYNSPLGTGVSAENRTVQ